MKRANCDGAAYPTIIAKQPADRQTPPDRQVAVQGRKRPQQGEPRPGKSQAANQPNVLHGAVFLVYSSFFHRESVLRQRSPPSRRPGHCPRSGGRREPSSSGQPGQLVDGPVVRGRFQAVEQPRLRQEQSPGADREDQFNLRGAGLDPVDQHGVVHLPPGALTAGNQEEIGPGAVGQAVVRVDAQATTGQDRPNFLGHSLNVEGWWVGEAVGDREDLKRPAEVQHFHVLEDQDGQVAGRRHGSGLRYSDESIPACTIIGSATSTQPPSPTVAVASRPNRSPVPGSILMTDTRRPAPTHSGWKRGISRSSAKRKVKQGSS